MDGEVIRKSTKATKIYERLSAAAEIVILLIRFLIEIILSTIKLFLGEEVKDVSKDIVLITGTGHGIGKELALQYAELGSQVVCIDINIEGNQETVKEINGINKGKAYGYTCDVSNRDKVLELAKKVKTEIGDVTILINNVGIMPTHPIEKHTPQEIQRLFNINVLSQFWTLEAFLPQMKANNCGHIVSISSLAGIVGLPNLVPYCATKFAVRGLMEGLYEEIRDSGLQNIIRCTTIYPYMVNTGLCKKPKIRFPSLLGLLEPKNVASAIIHAQRTNMRETTIPRALWHVNNICRLLPLKCALLCLDFIDSGVESDM